MHEATSAGAHMGLGVTTLGRANHAETGYYSQAFFALTVGFERAAKLALSMDQERRGNGFADRQTMVGYGHDLSALLAAVDDVADHLNLEGEARLPKSAIPTEIVAVLTDFANNLTRYYNLEFVAGEPAVASRQDPITAWYTRVTTAVLAEHDTDARRSRREAKAAQLRPAEGFALVRHQTETGKPLTSLEAGALHSSETDFARRWERMYVLQICRFLAKVIVQLSNLGRSEDIPVEFDRLYSIFLMNDSYFRSRATWSIH
jgi:hypothetical protein